MADRHTRGFEHPRNKGRRIGTLWWNDDLGDADVTMSEYFDSMGTLERVDAMGDIIGLLEREGDFCYEDYSGKKPESKEDQTNAVVKLLTDKDDEIERLREALLLADAALSGANMNMKVVQRVVRTALKEKTND
jgi:hypothetical protein